MSMERVRAVIDKACQDGKNYAWRGTECTKAIEIMTSGATGADAMYIGNIVKYLYRRSQRKGA